MGIFNSIKKSRRASSDIDEKIEYLNKELEKTGLREAMTTSGMYFATRENPGIPAVMADVPDSTGVLGSGFTPPIGGNGNANDPSNYPAAYDTAWMYNSNNVDGETNRPIVKTMDQSVIDAYNTAFPDDDRFPSGGAGIVFGNIAFGTGVGYASDGHYKGVLSPGLFGNGSTKIVPPGSAFGAPYFGMFQMYFPATPELANVIMAMSGAYLSLGGYNTDPSKVMTVQLWRHHSTFHDGQWDNWSGKKYTDSETNTRYVLGNFFMYKAANDYVKEPAVPVTTTVLYRDDLGNPDYLPINIDLGDLSRQAFDYLRDKASQALNFMKGNFDSNMDGMMEKMKDHWNQSWEDVKNFPNDLKKFGEDLVNMIDDAVPALDYSKDIAISILSNSPKDNSHKISEEDKQKLYDGLNYDAVSINDKKEPYADGNIIEDEKGNVRPRNQWPKDENGNDILPGSDAYKNMTDEQKAQVQAWAKDNKEHPNNTDSVQNMESEKEMNATMGASNPLAAAGKAQVQVYKNDNGEYVFSYTDHAYHNLNSTDEREVPGLGFLNPKLWISNAVHAIADTMYGRQTETNTSAASSGQFYGGRFGIPKPEGNPKNTGDMEGYPAGIYGDSIKKFETKVSDMPKEFQDWFYNKINQNNSYRLRGKESLNESVGLGHFEPDQLNVNIEDLRQGIMPEFPKDPPPEMVNGYSSKSRLAPKKLERSSFIKITKKDLAKNHMLKDSEIKDFMNKINAVNDFIKKHPEELIYAQTRYPKSDPRLAQLNWEMDQKLNASKQYMDKHYPENQKLFTKIQKSIKKNIELTDPKSFKGVKVPKFKGVDLTDFKRRKEVVARHYKKAVKVKKLFSRKKT